MIRKFWRVLVKFWKDIVYGPGNDNADLARLGVALGTLSVIGAAIWNILLGLPIELGPAGFPGGLGALYIGAAAFVYAKDRGKAENTVAKAINTTAETESIKEEKR